MFLQMTGAKSCVFMVPSMLSLFIFSAFFFFATVESALVLSSSPKKRSWGKQNCAEDPFNFIILSLAYHHVAVVVVWCDVSKAALTGRFYAFGFG